MGANESHPASDVVRPAPPFEMPPPMPRQPLRWRRAWRALRELLETPEDTQKAYDLFHAIGVRDYEKNFQRFVATATGRRLLVERPSLAGTLSDREALLRLPEDSLGRAYQAYLDRNGFRATALIELDREVQARWEREEGAPAIDPIRTWYHHRTLLSHDLFHVLTDYGTDDVGEATLLAFSLAQVGGRANALLTVGAAFEVWRALGFRWLGYDFRAWRRGRRASWLPSLPWEELLPMRLDTVRRLTGLESAEEAHPSGIIRGHIDEGRVFTPA